MGIRQLGKASVGVMGTEGDTAREAALRVEMEKLDEARS